MTSAVALIFVLFVSVIERSDAVSCYNCYYNSFYPEEPTCSEPFSAANTPTCNGPMCEVQYNWYSGLQNYYHVLRNCSTSGVGLYYRPELGGCITQDEQYGSINATYFAYGSGCCRVVSSTDIASQSKVINCECYADNCNGDLPHQIPNPGNLQSTTANRLSSAGDQQSTRANKISSAGSLPQAISKLSIVFVAMIAVLSIIS